MSQHVSFGVGVVKWGVTTFNISNWDTQLIHKKKNVLQLFNNHVMSDIEYSIWPTLKLQRHYLNQFQIVKLLY